MKRLIQFEALRSIAIILILFHHIGGFINSDLNMFFSPYIGRIGLGIFVFVSGYLLHYNNNDFKDVKSIYTFYIKRLKRIYFLYILSFFSLIAIHQIYITNIWGLLKYILILQVVLAPKFGSDNSILWFVGMISIFYIIYPWIIHFSKNNIDIFIYSFLLFLLLLVLRYKFDIIEARVFLYYYIFIGGIILSSIKFFEQKFYRILNIFSPIILIYSILLFRYFNLMDIKEIYDLSLIGALESILVLLIIITSYILVIYELAKSSTSTQESRVNEMFILIAYSSYATYLFHMQIFIVLDFIISKFFNIYARDFSFIILCFPLTFSISYYIQYHTDRILKAIYYFLGCYRIGER